MPESPRWLLINDRAEEANAVLRKLHTPEEAAIEFIQIKKQMGIDRRLPSSYVSLFTKPSYRKRTLIGIGMTCSVQFSGILVGAPVLSLLLFVFSFCGIEQVSVEIRSMELRSMNRIIYESNQC